MIFYKNTDKILKNTDKIVKTRIKIMKNTDKNLKTTMLTHLIPITRGIIVSCYVNLEDKG